MIWVLWASKTAISLWPMLSSCGQCMHLIRLVRWPGPKVLKLLCSTQLSMKFKLLINIKIVKTKDILTHESQSFILLVYVKMPTFVVEMPTFVVKICWHFKIYEEDKFYAQKS